MLSLRGGQSVTLIHSTLLLCEPLFGSSAVAWLDSGTSVQIERYVQGFFAISIHQTHGFIPAALCHLQPLQHTNLPKVYTDRTLRLAAALPPATRRISARSISPYEPLLCLGQDRDFLLVQTSDGHLGFFPRALQSNSPPDTSSEFGVVLEGCGWLLIGFLWACLNWLALRQGIAALLDLPTIIQAITEAALMIGVTILMWSGPRQRFGRVFVIGVFVAACLVLVMILPTVFL